MAAGKSAMEGRWVDFGEIIRTECVGDQCKQFGTLLNEEGKLGKNWVRGALLSIERDATDPSDISECFALFDVDGDGKLNGVEIAELMDKLGPELDAAQRTKVFSDADKDGDKLITLDEFMEAYKASGQTLIESVGFKGTFEFQNLMD